VDLALTPLTHRTSPALRFEPVLSTPLALACPAGHRLSGAHDVDMRELIDEPIIDLPPGWWARDLFDHMLEERDLSRQVRLEVNEWFGLLTLVERGVGMSYGPRACLDAGVVSDVAVATLADPPPWELGIATRDEALRGAVGRGFLDAYRQQIRSG
jgi:DNA-binding transcriptional LysR family regulator